MHLISERCAMQDCLKVDKIDDGGGITRRLLRRVRQGGPRWILRFR